MRKNKIVFLLKSKYVIAVVCKVLSIFITFLASVFINRSLGVFVKGEYAYILRIVDMLYIIVGVGLGQVYSIYKKRQLVNAKSIFSALIILHVAFVAIVGSVFTYIFEYPYGYAIFLITAASVFHNNISMIGVIEDSIKRNVLVTCINIFYLLGLITLYFSQTSSLFTTLFLYGANEVIISCATMFVFKMKPSFNTVNSSILRGIYINGMLTMVVILLISINYSIDIVMLKHLSNNYSVGIYSVAVTFSNMFLIIPDAFKEIMFGDSLKKGFQKNVLLSIKVSFLISFAILIGFAVLGKDIIKLLYGVEYVDSYALTLIIFIGSLAMIFFKILHPIYISHAKQIRLSIILTLSAITNILLNIYLIPIYDAVGTAIATAISYTICGVIILIDYHYSLRKKKIMRC